MLRAAVVLIPCACLLAACGGGSGGAPTKPGASPAQMLLRRSDFPKNWKTGSTESTHRCDHAATVTVRASAAATSLEFYLGGFTAAFSSAGIYRDAQQADLAFRRSASLPVLVCYGDLLSNAVQAQHVTVRDVFPGPLSFPRTGDQSKADTLIFRARYRGKGLTLYADVIRFRSGRAIAVLIFTNALKHFPLKDEEYLAQKILERMKPAA